MVLSILQVRPPSGEEDPHQKLLPPFAKPLPFPNLPMHIYEMQLQKVTIKILLFQCSTVSCETSVGWSPKNPRAPPGCQPDISSSIFLSYHLPTGSKVIF